MKKKNLVKLSVVALAWGTLLSFGGIKPVEAAMHPTTEAFVKKIAIHAHKSCSKNDQYTSITIAQAILESGSGKSGLSRSPHHNLFGIKGSYKGRYVSLNTAEHTSNGNAYIINASFRSYPSYYESIHDHTRLLSKSFYSGTRMSKTSNYKQAAYYLQGRYASDPSYASKLIGTIQANNLTRFDKKELNSDDIYYLTGKRLVVKKPVAKKPVVKEKEKEPEIPDNKDILDYEKYLESTAGTNAKTPVSIEAITFLAEDEDSTLEEYHPNMVFDNSKPTTNTPKVGKGVLFTSKILQVDKQLKVLAISKKGSILLAESEDLYKNKKEFKILTKEEAALLSYYDVTTQQKEL